MMEKIPTLHVSMVTGRPLGNAVVGMARGVCDIQPSPSSMSSKSSHITRSSVTTGGLVCIEGDSGHHYNTLRWVCSEHRCTITIPSEVYHYNTLMWVVVVVMWLHEHWRTGEVYNSCHKCIFKSEPHVLRVQFKSHMCIV